MGGGVSIYIYACSTPPPSVIYFFRGFPGHVREHVPKTRGHIQFLMRTPVYRLLRCVVRIVWVRDNAITSKNPKLWDLWYIP